MNEQQFQDPDGYPVEFVNIKKKNKNKIKSLTLRVAVAADLSSGGKKTFSVVCYPSRCFLVALIAGIQMCRLSWVEKGQGEDDGPGY